MSTQLLEKSESLSVITSALEQAHEIIKQETGAPRATILVTRALKGARAHFTTWEPWQAGEQGFHEIALNGEIFAEGAESVLGSLLHETAHSMNHAEGVQDCSSNQYHNKHFKNRAESLGLSVSELKGHGFARTMLAPDAILRWAIPLAIISQALSLTALSSEGASAKPKGRNTNLLKAGCGCGNTLRASLKVITAGISCDACGEGFQLVL
jgi:hypothetical protein